MTQGGLFTGFDAYRVLDSEEIQNLLSTGMVALDANVLLNLYRYNERTTDELLSIARACGDRLFIPHQVLREFWRNRQTVLASLGGASKETQSALQKNSKSSRDAIQRWAKSTALPPAQLHEIENRIDEFYEDLGNRVATERARVQPGAAATEDSLLQKLDVLLDGRVGTPLDDDEWRTAVAEGERRVEQSVPPGYMDIDKLDSDLPERASGDYLVWHQLLIEGARRTFDLVLVTADTKEDWWDRQERVGLVGPRRELIDEYRLRTGRRFILLEPGDLILHSQALGVGTSPESVEDIERVRDEGPDSVPWNADAVRAVLRKLEAEGCIQASVIKEAIKNGGQISRERVYKLDNRDPQQMLRGFTRPATRITADLQDEGIVPYGVLPILGAVYEAGVKSSHFAVPAEVVALMQGEFDPS